MNRVRELGAGVLAVRASLTGVPGLRSQQSFFFPGVLECDPIWVTFRRDEGVGPRFPPAVTAAIVANSIGTVPKDQPSAEPAATVRQHGGRSFSGPWSARILLLAHMGTVYERGMLAQQPFRIDGDRAYGLGIADDKHGIAVILHALTMLKALSVDGYDVIPDTTVDVRFETVFPPMPFAPASLPLAEHVQRLYYDKYVSGE